MGSSQFAPHWAVLAVFFAAVYLLFDAARFYVQRLGAVGLRRLASEPRFSRGGAWFQNDPEQFSLISGTLIQVCLVGGLAATHLAFRPGSSLSDLAVTALYWGLMVFIWKLLIAILPESLAEKAVIMLIGVSHLVYYVFWPLLFPVRWTGSFMEKRREENESEDDVSDEEVQAYLDVGEDEGIFEEGEARLVQSIVDFGDCIAREVMTPRVEVMAFDDSRTFDDLAAQFNESKFSRIPIYKGDIDHIVGVVHVKDLLDVILRGKKGQAIDIARPPYFVSGTKKVTALLREFQIEHIHLAIVVDEFGGTAGVVSIEDLVEEIVGEIADEHEEDEQSVVEIEDGVYLVNGITSVALIEEMFGTELEEDGFETVAGLIVTATGRVPGRAEVVQKGGLLFEVERADKRRIFRVRVRRDPAAVEAV